MPEPVSIALGVAILAPLVASVIAGCRLLLGDTLPDERRVSLLLQIALTASLLASVYIAAGNASSWQPSVRGEVDLGSWIAIGSYEVPAVFFIDNFAVVFSLLGAVVTALVARFSQTYLHKDPGFFRFYVLLGLFAAGTQLVAFAGALDLFFAGWEAIGIASTLFIGFFHERAEPVRSAVRAFVTYRVCDVGFLIAIVATHELIGSTRLSALGEAGALPAVEVTVIALLLLLAACGKSAQLPFSGWLVRAMEGPTPSSALFYGGVSIHAGLYLLLRTAPLLEAAPIAAAFGVAVGLSTAVYASAVARTQADAKGGLAQGTLAQIGLILAEICLGWTTLALVHLTSHALLRVWQYLRAPNMLHDAHHHDHHQPGVHHEPRWRQYAPRLSRRLYLGQLHRFRLDDRLDALLAPVLALSRALARLDERYFNRSAASQERGMIAPADSLALLTFLAVLIAILVVVPDFAERGRPRRASLLNALLAALAVFAPVGWLAYAIIATATIVHAVQVWPSTRGGAAMLAAASIATAACAATMFWQGSADFALLASLSALALRAGLAGLHGGVSALCRWTPVVQAQQFASLLVFVFVHLRFVDQSAAVWPVTDIMVLLGAGSALVFALTSLVQRDLDGLLRASMLMHGGMLLAATATAGNGHHIAALFVSLTMTLALAGLGMTVLALEARVGKVMLLHAAGRARTFPRLAAAFGFFGAAGVGMPGTAGFIADDLVLHALWTESILATIAITLASALLAIGTLRAIALVFMGPPTASIAPDLTRVERGLAFGLVLLLIGIGLLPQLVVSAAAGLLGGEG